MREPLDRDHPDQRGTGRPTKVIDAHDDPRESWPSSADASDGEDGATVAPEERGGTPDVEHAPGSDL